MASRETTILALFNGQSLFKIFDGPEGPTRGDHVLREEEYLGIKFNHEETIFCALDKKRDLVNFYPENVDPRFPSPLSEPLILGREAKGIGELSKSHILVTEHLESLYWQNDELPHSVLLVILESRDLGMVVNLLRGSNTN